MTMAAATKYEPPYVGCYSQVEFVRKRLKLRQMSKIGLHFHSPEAIALARC
jgi:hypothetical protein